MQPYVETDRVINYRKELGPPPATVNRTDTPEEPVQSEDPAAEA